MVSVIEISMFRLEDGTDEATFLAADRAVQAELAPRKGFLRRTAAANSDGDWLVVTLWGSPGDADESARTAFESPAAQGFELLLARATVETKRYGTLG